MRDGSTRTTTRNGGVGVAERWTQHLRQHNKDKGPGPARSRALPTLSALDMAAVDLPPSSSPQPAPSTSNLLAANRPPSSSAASLLSFESDAFPLSPSSAATSPTSYGPTGAGGAPAYRHSHHLTTGTGRHGASSARSVTPNSSQARRTSLPAMSSSNHANDGGPSRHKAQLERVYASERYDAEFDRGAGAPSSGGRGQPSGSQRALYVPGGPVPVVSSSAFASPFAAEQQQPARRAGKERERERDETQLSPPQQQQQGRKERSRREPVDLADLGGGQGTKGKGSKDSLESEEGGGRPASRTSNKSRRKREPSRKDEDGPSASASRHLFDPRKDDPVRFPQTGPSSKRNTLNSDSRSFASSAVSFASTSSAATDSSQPRQRRREAAGGAGAGGEEQRADEANTIVRSLKKAYKAITDLEVRLQEEPRALHQPMRDDEDSVRIQGGGRKYDDEYWVRTTMKHKDLAEAHFSFLHMALDPRIPSSLHSLPQKYTIPTRLWQVAFHGLLERMRHAIASGSATDPCPPASVLEHLIEFIQYAYTFYTQLVENTKMAVFRSAWIEQLGDLARYRMAVAGLASKISSSAAPPAAGGLTSEQLQGLERPAGAAVARDVNAPSIGEAALNDWDFEEQELWKDTAKGWYGRGLTETPGMGRLHHHLALLSKGDDMRALYHFAKSLTATHPYVSARESILPLFEAELQARRTRPEVIKGDLFVHLHGMLFTKISLDDFEEVSARFVEVIEEEGLLLEKGWDRSKLGQGADAPFGDPEWFMLAVTNIAAIMQYGAEDSLLRRAVKPHSPPPTGRHSKGAAAAKHHLAKAAPQAIMLNSSSLRRADAPADDLLDDDNLSFASSVQGTDSVVRQLGPAASETAENPAAFDLAQKLTAEILSLVFTHSSRDVGGFKCPNPYLTLILTFYATMVQQPAALRRLERQIPWYRLVHFLNANLPEWTEVNPHGATKLSGQPLPEDWCIRGMDWAGRSLFSRGYWQSAGGSQKRRGDAIDEMAPMDMGDGPREGGGILSELDALAFDIEDLTVEDTTNDSGNDSGSEEKIPSAVLARSRWSRIATVAGWLVKSVPGFEFDPASRMFSITGSLDAKLRGWEKEKHDVAEATRRSLAAAAAAASTSHHEEDAGSDYDDDEEDEIDASDSPEVQELRKRRHELRQVLRKAREASRLPNGKSNGSRSGTTRRPASCLKIIPGYSVLVFDTNTFLTSLHLIRQLVELRTWTVIVPLAVITELDGLKRNVVEPLGTSAITALQYLEKAIVTSSRFLKVQTSKGNYLRDLTLRSENIDFTDSASGASHEVARSLDDIILRAVSWQKEHFSPSTRNYDAGAIAPDTAKVILVSFDRNLRLKAQARELDAIDEKGLKGLASCE